VSQQRGITAPAAATGGITVRRGHPRVWLLPVLYGTLTAAGLSLQGFAGRPEDPTQGLAGGVVVSAAILVWSLGGSLLVRRTSNPIGWLLSGTALAWAIQQFSFGYGAYGLVAHPGSLPAAIPVALLDVTMPLLVQLGIALLFLLFPDGRLPSARWRPVLWTGLVACGVLVPNFIVYPGPIGNLGIRNPIRVEAWLQAILAPLTLVAFMALFAALLASVLSLLLRLRRSRGEERQQLKWFTYATALVPVGFGLLFFGSGRTTDQLGTALLAVASVAMPVAVAIAILKYRLYGIDRIINRTIVYGVLTAILGLGYTGAVLVLGQALGHGRSNLALAVATLATAAAFQPARRRVQEAVDRRFNRRRYDVARTIEAFSGRLREQIELDTLTEELLVVVSRTMEPTFVSLWLRPPNQR
jgi:hypothetical protein